MKYEEMSDFEINKAVANALGLDVADIDDSKKTGMTTLYHNLRPNTVWVSDDINPWEQYAPCNSWTDAGPIIQDNGIGIVRVDEASCGTCGVIGRWHAVGPVDWAYGECDSDVAHWDKNPLRAAMIVFLTMREADNA